MANENIKSKSARKELAIQKKPYFHAIAPGISLGYRRNAGAGTWLVRAGWTKRFAVADDVEESNGGTVLNFTQALKKAAEIARTATGEGTGDRPQTVEEAVAAYGADLKSRGANVGNADNVRYHMTGSPLWTTPVALLEEPKMKVWRNGLVTAGAKPATANRTMNSLKAALYLAAKADKRIVNSREWNMIKKLPEGDTARNIILSDANVRAVVQGSYTLVSREFGMLIDTLAETGARESQLMRTMVEDLQDGREDPRLMVPNSRKGENPKNEYVALPISTRLAAILRNAVQGRALDAPIFAKCDNPADGFRKVTKNIAGIDPKATPYSLRHSSIVRQLLAGLRPRVVASNHNTSVTMIEKHYSRRITDVTDSQTRATLPDFSDNVVKLVA